MGLYQTPLMIASLLLCIGSPSGVGAKHTCLPSSCGNLQIRYPFRLKGDKPTCGDRRYELTCDGNRTIIDINSGKYYVNSISYSKDDVYIQITDVGLASGDCALPSNTLTLDTISHDGRFIFSSSPFLGEAFFVNCTREIKRWPNFYLYSHVPCLSRSNALVYVIWDAFVRDIAPSCTYIAMVLSNEGNNEIAETNEDVFKFLQNGILLKCANPSCDPMPSFVKYCFAVAWRLDDLLKEKEVGQSFILQH